MDSTPPVCLVIAVRNVAEYLAETLESVLAQTFRDWTAIVVDDGSTDTTPEVAAGFADADPRITVLRQDWKGVSAARNYGVQRAAAKAGAIGRGYPIPKMKQSKQTGTTREVALQHPFTTLPDFG